MHALTGGIAAGQQAQDRPGGLRGSALGGRKYAIVITGATLAPSAISVLNGAQPLAGAQDVDFAIVFARGSQAPQRETGTVNISDTPAAVPASVGFLGTDQMIHAAPHGLVAAIEAMRGQSFQYAAGDIGA